jgi:hypothetical protein
MSKKWVCDTTTIFEQKSNILAVIHTHEYNIYYIYNIHNSNK